MLTSDVRLNGTLRQDLTSRVLQARNTDVGVVESCLAGELGLRKMERKNHCLSDSTLSLKRSWKHEVGCTRSVPVPLVGEVVEEGRGQNAQHRN